MSKNDQILIEQIIKQEFAANDEYTKEDDFFEFYTASQVLRNYDLSYDEIESGICGKSLDGGADSIYIFVNGELIDEDTPVAEKYKKNSTLELVIIQSKNVKSFGEDAILKLSRLSKNLLDLEFDASNYIKRYNNTVISKFELFRKTYFSLLTKKPILKVKYYYITKGTDVHPNVEHQINDLKSEISSILTEAGVSFHTVGAGDMLEIYRKKEDQVFQLKLTENPLSSQGKVFISLVGLKDFYDFITDEEGKLRRHIFEANVRDYQGKTNVNSEIQETLSNNNKEDFWWLNNGVTILAEDVSAPGGKELVIHNPEIVNGLQTSTEVYKYFDKNKGIAESRSVLVRVIVPESENSRDKIIRATNSQTTIPKASLRATDPIHRDIEDYFKPRGIYYDRRKNYYKNEGKKHTEIVTLPFLSQCVMAITLQKPDFARARPSTLLEDNTAYNKLYNRENDVKAYYIAAIIGKKVEIFIKCLDEISTSDKNNIKFYIAYVLACVLTNSQYPSFSSLANLDYKEIDNEIISIAYKVVIDKYQEMGGGDKLSKGPELIKELKSNVVKLLKGQETVEK